MPEMKYSGVEWIGEVPENWNLMTIGSLFHVRNEKVSDTEYAPLSVSRGGVVPQMENVAKTDANDNRKLVLKNDFAINSRSDRKQSCGVSPLDGSVSLINTVLYAAPTAPMVTEYPNILMKNYGFAEEFYRWGHGIVADLWTTRWQEMKSILLPIPSEDEQRRIIDKVVIETQKIANLIANQEAQIEKLKAYKQSLITEVVTKGLDSTVPMKDSGVEWIGEIPEHWELLKLTQLCERTITYGIVKLGDHDDDGVKVLRCSDVREGFIDESNIRTVTKSLSDEYRRTVLKGNEVVVNVRGSLGGCAVVPESMAGYNIAREVAMVDVQNCNPNFVKYVLLSRVFATYQDFYLAGSVYVGLNIDLLNRFQVPLPERNEQDAIVKWLDYRCERLDQLIKTKQQKIERLNEYKKSLIYEYVTGKKEVI